MTRAGEIFDRLLAARPSDPVRQRNVALAQKYLGAYQESLHNFEAALTHFARARELDEKRLAVDPSNHLAQIDLAMDLGNVGHMQARTVRTDEAIAAYERSLEIRQRLADADPNDVFAKGRVAFVHFRLAELYGKTGMATLSIDHAQKAARLAESIGHLDPMHRGDLAEAWVVLGEAEQRAGATAAACRHYRQADAVLRELVAQKMTASQQADRRRLVNRLADNLHACQPAPAGPPRAASSRRP
jgi:tetratricopeptide (TPR) repeat protein